VVEVRERITAVVNRLLAGELPPLARAYVCGANLSALAKKDGGLRPIACGDVWRRLAARCVCKDFADRFREVLAPQQFGVAVRGGTEVLVHASRLLFEEASQKSDFQLLKFDFKNAFNCVSRQAFLDEVATRFPSLFPFVSLCYGASSVLLFGDRRLASTSGVQQGDPLRPLLFCLAIHPVLRRISEECPGLESNSWYLDDGVVAGPSADVVRALSIIQAEGPARGMVLNASKSEVWSPSGVHPSEVAHFRHLPVEGFEMLGSPVGSEGFCQAVFAQKVVKWRSLWKAISGLPHLQTQALLLRFCASFCKVVHLLRTVPPHLLGPSLSSFDREFRSFMEEVTGPTTDFVWAWITGRVGSVFALLLSTLWPLQLGGFCPSPSLASRSSPRRS